MKNLEIISMSFQDITIDITGNTRTNAFKHSFKYADRVRMRAVQDPVSHNFPNSFDDAYLVTKFLETMDIKYSSNRGR